MRWAMVLAALLGGSGQAQALGRLAEMQVIDRTTGSTLRVYEHRGKHYVVGEPGHEYAVSLTNRDAGRLMAVGSVDGVNIVSGDTAAVDQNGYVLAPRQSFTINGWRTSLQTTAAFYFTTVQDSYAARTGRPDDLGVIGFALFRENTRCCDGWAAPRVEEQRARPEADAAAPPSASAKSEASASARAQRDDRVGTGYGRNEYSYVTYTDFEPASPRPSEMLTLYYDSYENLRRKGVIPARSRWQPREPRPFPGGHFVPAP
jgi:hypothetical protein